MDRSFCCSLVLTPSTPFLKTHFQLNPNCKPAAAATTFSNHNNSLKSLLIPQPFTNKKDCIVPPSPLTNVCSRRNLSFFLTSRTLSRLNATAVSENSEDENAAKNSKKWYKNLQLGAMFGVWYSLNIYFNIFNKQVLKVFPFPATLTAFQFACGTLLVIVMWGFNLYPKPKLKKSQVAPIITLALAHTVGNVLTNISLGKVAVSFTHTIKAMEPFFTVIFSVLFLAERPTLWVSSSLIPIVGGVALASFTEASFNWIGFSTAMASNITNQSRNVLSKKFMIREEDGLDNINLFSVISILSFILLVPIAILMEGVRFTPAYLQHYTTSQGINVKDLCIKALVSGICFHSYQQVSYMILEMVSAVTHAVGNCVKRVVVILSSVIFFKTPVSPINSLGTSLALAGVFLYSRAKQIKTKPKAV